MPIIRLLLLMLITAVTAGCMAPKSFVDPSFPKLSYEELGRRASPLKLVLRSEFQRNGEPLGRADPTLRDNTERILRASGVVTPSTEGAEGEIRVVVNNVADVGTAFAKGFGSGLTFGIVGTTVTDAYEMTVTITVAGRTFSRSGVRHALHTTLGNTSTPDGLETVAPNVAFERVLEQMILRVLKEYQASPEYSLFRWNDGRQTRDGAPARNG